MSFAAFALAIAASAWSDGGLSRQVDALVRDARLGSARIGISIVDMQTGESLVSVDADTPYIPASNMKVLSTGAALHVLGKDYVFRTELLRVGDDFVLRGSGDPALGDPEFLAAHGMNLTSDQLLDALARAAADAGITSWDEFIVDDRAFDREIIHPRWPTDQLDKHYCAPVAGVNFHRNVLDFFPNPAADGVGPPTFQLQPGAPWIARDVRVNAKSVSRGQNTIWVRRDPVQNRFTLVGEVRYPSQMPIRVSVHDPAILAGQLLADRLTRAGVAPANPGPDGFGPVRLANPGEDLSQGKVIAVVTTPLVDILELCNHESINLYADALIKAIGHAVSGEPGSWQNGGSVLRMVLAERLGPDAAASTTISDGSGMSRQNAVTPKVFTAWLESLYEDPALGSAFVESLASVGEGTLDDRFRQTRLRNALRAKSGYINGVRTLSGYLIHEDSGRALAFSILINDLPLSSGVGVKARNLHEQIVAAADQWLTEHASMTAQAPE